MLGQWPLQTRIPVLVLILDTTRGAIMVEYHLVVLPCGRWIKLGIVFDMTSEVTVANRRVGRTVPARQ